MSVKYSKEHEWVRMEGDAAVVGISDYAQEQLGEIVFVELPDVGKQLEKGDEAAVIESVKAASEVYTPVSGTVSEVNGDLDAAPATVNRGDNSQYDNKNAKTSYREFSDDRIHFGLFINKPANTSRYYPGCPKADDENEDGT